MNPDHPDPDSQRFHGHSLPRTSLLPERSDGRGSGQPEGLNPFIPKPRKKVTAERSKQYEQNRRKKQDRLEREKQDLAEQEARRQFQLRQEYEAIRAAALAEAAQQGGAMERLAKEREQEYETIRRQDQERESERLERERQQREKEENERQKLEEERSTAEALEAMRPRSFEGEWKSNVEEVKDAGLRGNRRELAERIKKAGAVHGAWTHAGVTEAEPEEEEGQEEPKKSRNGARRSERVRRPTRR